MIKVPISTFRGAPINYFNEAEKTPVIITKHRKPTHVLITKKLFDYLVSLRKNRDN